MALIFVNAPNQIFKYVVPLIEEKKFNVLKIVTSQKLAPFFKEHTQAEVLVPKVNPNLINFNSKHKIFFSVLKSYFEYNRLFTNIKNEEVYVFFTSWSVVFFSFIKQLSKKNKIFFYLGENNYNPDFEKECVVFRKERSLRAIIMQLIAKLFLSVDIFILNKSGVPVWELERYSFPMEIVKYKPDENLTNNYFSNNIISSNKEILFLGADIGSEGADEKSVVSVTDYLFDILDKNFSDKYLIKSHPRESKIYGKMANSQYILPPTIMAETLMGHDWKYVIGYYSNSLISAKKHTNAKVISLLHLWKWSNPELKELWREMFKNNQILLPKSYEELNDILKKI